MTKLLIKEFTKSNRAISALDGEKVFQQITANFQINEPVILDFEGIELTITAFLNSSIGKLYGVYTSEQIKQLLDIVNLNNDEKRLLKLVIEKAKERFGKYNDTNDDNIDVVNES
jgi:hypothetical protein